MYNRFRLSIYRGSCRKQRPKLVGLLPSQIHVACQTPGGPIQTSIWEVGPGPNGTTELAFEAKDLTTGKVCDFGSIPVR